MNKELTVREAGGAVALTEGNRGLSIRDAFQAIVTGNLDADKLKVMKDLLDMDAERQFNAAFVSLQSDMPVIVAKSVIPNRGKYERFEDIMTVIGPLLTIHGFTVSFSQDFKENRILETCTLSHSAGHSRSNSFAVRAGGRSDSDTQADCKAATTAKRNALCNALNIVIRQDCLSNEDDAGIDGDPNAFVTKEQSEELAHRLQMVNGSTKDFLAYAKAESFAKIPAIRYAEIDALLMRKERSGK